MSLLKLRTTTTVFSIHRLSVHKYSRHFRNPSALALSSGTCHTCSFHSISSNKHENLLTVSPFPLPSASNRRNLSTINNDPFYVSLVKFFAESESTLEIQRFAVQLHDMTGLHWWSTIVLMTFGARFCVTFPMAIYQQHILAKVEIIQQEMIPIVMQLKKEASVAVNKIGMTPELVKSAYQKSVRKQWIKLILRDNCHPMKAVLPLFLQIPLWIHISSALRNIISLYPPDDSAMAIAAAEMGLGGPLWCSNLLIPDPTFITPILLGLTNLAILEVQMLMKYTENTTTFRKAGTYVLRGVILLTVPLAAQMPAAISFYWLSSSMFGLGQNLVLLSPTFRRVCRIRHTPSEVDQPYRTLCSRFVDKMGERKNWVLNRLKR